MAQVESGYGLFIAALVIAYEGEKEFDTLTSLFADTKAQELGLDKSLKVCQRSREVSIFSAFTSISRACRSRASPISYRTSYRFLAVVLPEFLNDSD